MRTLNYTRPRVAKFGNARFFIEQSHLKNLVLEVQSNNVRLLSPGFRSFASVCLILHLGILFATLSTVSVKSTIRDRLLDIVLPYTASAHMHLGGRAIADVTHSMADWRHRFEYRLDDDSSWMTTDLDIGNSFGGNQRFERYLTTIAEASQREDTATAAMLAEPLVERLVNQLSIQSQFDGSSGLSISALPDFQVRVTAVVYQTAESPSGLYRVGKRESRADLSSQPDSILTPEIKVRWQAGIVRQTGAAKSKENGWSVVFLEEPRLNAKASATNIVKQEQARIGEAE